MLGSTMKRKLKKNGLKTLRREKPEEWWRSREPKIGRELNMISIGTC